MPEGVVAHRADDVIIVELPCRFHAVKAVVGDTPRKAEGLGAGGVALLVSFGGRAHIYAHVADRFCNKYRSREHYKYRPRENALSVSRENNTVSRQHQQEYPDDKAERAVVAPEGLGVF